MAAILHLITLMLTLSPTLIAQRFWMFNEYNYGGDIRLFTGSSNYIGSSYNDKVKSYWAEKGDWELYEHMNYEGKRLRVNEGTNVGSPSKTIWSSIRPICNNYNSNQYSLMVYEHRNKGGKSRQITGAVSDLGSDWDNKISSMQALKGNWELYEHPDYSGKRTTIYYGNYDSSVQYNDKYSSVRPICY